MNKNAVIDTGPIIHLQQAEAIELLGLIGDIWIPKTVIEELEGNHETLPGLEVTIAEVDYDNTTFPQLDPGESAALALCLERDALLITDDLDARRIVQREGVEVHGSIGVILYAFSQDELSAHEARRLLRSLQQDTNLYLTGPLIEHAINLVETNDAGW